MIFKVINLKQICFLANSKMNDFSDSIQGRGEKAKLSAKMKFPKKS